MNPDEKLRELGKQLDLSDEDIDEVNKSKMHRKNYIIYTLLGAIPLYILVQGFIFGKELSSYPFRFFFRTAYSKTNGKTN